MRKPPAWPRVALPEKPELLWKFPVDKGCVRSHAGDCRRHRLHRRHGWDVLRDRFANRASRAGSSTTATTRPASTRRRRFAMGWFTSAIWTAIFFVSMPKPARRNGSPRPTAEINSAANFYQRQCAVRLARCHAVLPRCQNRRETMDAPNRRSNSLLAHGGRGSLLSGRLRWQAARHRSGKWRRNWERSKSKLPPAARRPRRAILIYFGTEGATFFCIDWKAVKEVWHWQDKVAPIADSLQRGPDAEAVIFGGRRQNGART